MSGSVPRRDRKSPEELWQQAIAENRGKSASARRRYRELMRDHGHIVAPPPPSSQRGDGR